VQFKGRLRLPDDTGAGIPVDLRLDDIFLVLVAEGETLGEWRMDDVGVQRVFSNQFLLDLEGEEMVFVADDPLGFAYEGVAEIEATTARLTKRWRGRKKKRRADESTTAVVNADRVEADRARERRSAAAEATAVSDVPVVDAPSTSPPADHPTPAAPAAAEWPVAAPETAPIVENPVADRAEPGPAINEPASPASEPVVPRAPEQVVEPAVEPVVVPPEAVPTFAPAQEPAVQEVADPAEVQPAIEPEIPEVHAEPIFEEPGYEIEEVVVPAATSAFAVVEEERSEPEPVIPAEDSEGFLSVEPASPGIAAVADVAPLSEEIVRPEVDELPEIGAGLDDGPVGPGSGPHGETQIDVEESLPEEAAQSPLRSAAAAARAAIEDEPASEPEADEDIVVEEAPRHLRERKASRRSRKSRRKKPEAVEHTHTYDEKSAVGGIIRRVCSQCGHVSFGSEDVYEDWGA
jgi:hypothetical protein